MKGLYKIMVFLIAIPIASYLVLSFILWELNPQMWNEAHRVGTVVITLILCLFAILMNLGDDY